MEKIISSPYERAIQTIQPLAKQQKLEIEVSDKLKERILSPEPINDWQEKLKETFEDPSLKLEGGESSEEATSRILEVVEGVMKSDVMNTILVTHGNLMALLLNRYNEQFGFTEWANLRNPDVYLLKVYREKVSFEQIWHS